MSVEKTVLVQTVAWVYVIVNTGRVCFYLPQLRTLLKLHGSAAGVSALTWGAFALSHLTTLLYALVVVEDGVLATISFLNMFFSCAIFALALLKQASPGWRRGMLRRLLPVMYFFRIR